MAVINQSVIGLPLLFSSRISSITYRQLVVHKSHFLMMKNLLIFLGMAKGRAEAGLEMDFRKVEIKM